MRMFKLGLRLEPGTRLGLDRRLVQQHHGDVVLDRIHAFALPALEGRAILDELHFRLAVGARQDFQELRIDGHNW
jgi:hypothetical protein